MRLLVFLMSAGFSIAAFANNPPTCAANPLAVTSDTLFTPEYYGNSTALTYDAFRGCSGTQTVDSVSAQLMGTHNEDFQVQLLLKGGSPSAFMISVGYTAANGQFQYSYSASKLSIAADSLVTIQPTMDGCISCPVVAKVAAQPFQQDMRGDTLVVKINFISGANAYPVTLKSVVRMADAIRSQPRAQKPEARKALFLPEFLGRKIEVNPEGLPFGNP